MSKKLFKSLIFLFLFSLIISGCNEKDEPHFFELDKTALVFGPERESQTIEISTNGNWTASWGVGWVVVSPRSGEGNTTVTVTALENESFQERKIALVFRSGTETVTVEVTQRGDYLEFDKTELLFEPEGGTQNITISSNKNWVVYSRADWVTVSPQSDERNATVTVTTSENESFERKAMLTAYSTRDNTITQVVMIEIIQKGNLIMQGVDINGVRWATSNVDMPGVFAATPENSGMFYQWNRRVALHHSSFIYEDWAYTAPSGSMWSRDNDPCPPGWRVPTSNEFRRLIDNNNVVSEWVSTNRTRGKKFTDRITGDSIFLPKAGLRADRNVFWNTSVAGYYWSSTSSGTLRAWKLNFYGWWSEHPNVTQTERVYALSIRCVAE